MTKNCKESRTLGDEESLSYRSHGRFVGAFKHNAVSKERNSVGEIIANRDAQGADCIEMLGLLHISGNAPRYIFLGGGHSRAAWYDTFLDVVIKTRDNHVAREGNTLEYAAWKFLSRSKKRKFLCPAFSISTDGDVIKMQPARPLENDELVILVDGMFQYYRRDNFGWIQISPTIERLVSIDYADIDLEAEFNDYVPNVSREKDTAWGKEISLVGEDVRLLKVGDCRNIHTFERCDEEGNPLPPLPKKIMAEYYVKNNEVIFGLGKVMEKNGVSKSLISRVKKAYLEKIAKEKDIGHE